MAERIYIQKLNIPENYEIPKGFSTERFLIRPLKINDAVKDYDAIMTSIDHIKNTKGVLYVNIDENYSLEDNIVALGWHQFEFEQRTSFAFTIMNHDESKCLGCIYIYYSDDELYDVEISMWVRKSEANTGLRKEVYIDLKNWIKNEWPFENPLYLGKEE